MSLLNIFLSPSKALIGTDTEALEEATGGFITMSKMLHVPHLNVVVAARGESGFMLTVFSMVAQGKAGDFDELAKSMPQLLGKAHSLIMQIKPAYGESPLCDHQQVALVGWSATCKRMQAFLYTQSDPSAGFNLAEIEEPGA